MTTTTPNEIESLCVERLRESFNRATGLFDRQLRHGAWGGTQGTECLTSTAIALIGLARADITPDRLGIDRGEAREALIASARSRRYFGSIGLVIWANCVTGGRSLADLLGQLGLSLGELKSLARAFQTMEVAWLVSGLAHEVAREPGRATRDAFQSNRDALIARFVEPTRIFRHATDDAPPLRRVRRWVANFADQIYPIQALALSATLGDDGRAMDVATRSAEQMVALQGPLGQWWWHYNAREGRVSQAYPVYSVHQHGMAPMALRSLAIAGGPRHDRAVDLGRRWLDVNELNSSLIDRGAGTIWRDIERDESRVSRYARRARSVLGLGGGDPAASGARLRINRETRPYEWAWCLFAMALARREKETYHLI